MSICKIKSVIITDTEIVNEGWFLGARKPAALKWEGEIDVAFLELYSDCPDNMPDEKYVEMANNFVSGVGVDLVFLKKLSQDPDGVISWEVERGVVC